MDLKLEQAYLYDFYGELLNERQRKIYEDFYFNDLSLGEIAAEEGISRQGVYDLAKRSIRTLEGYEGKLHLVEKYLLIQSKVKEIRRLAASLPEECPAGQEIARIAEDVLGAVAE